MTPQDLAYAAALIDTLAVLKVRTLDETDLPVIVVNSARHPEAVAFLCRLTGSKVTEVPKDYAHRGCNEHCPDKHTHVVSTSRRWQVVGVKATIVLHGVLPYLRVQKDEARRLIQQGRSVGYKGQVVNQMARLGWEMPDLKPQPRARVALAAGGQG